MDLFGEACSECAFIMLYACACISVKVLILIFCWGNATENVSFLDFTQEGISPIIWCSYLHLSFCQSNCYNQAVVFLQLC